MFLLICGCPRSGTTELAFFLNRHDDIALGCERYLHRWRNCETSVTLASFDPHNFADLRPGETFWASLDDMPGWTTNPGARTVKEKIGNARVFGDKCPDEVFHLRETLPRLGSDARALICVRDLLSVIRSWQARADNAADDLWSRTADAETGLRHWTGALAILTEYASEGLPVLDIYMPDFYGPDRHEAKRALGFLGLDFDHPSEATFHDKSDWQASNAEASPDAPKAPSEAERAMVLGHAYVATAVRKLRSAAYRIPLDRLFWSDFEAEFDSGRPEQGGPP